MSSIPELESKLTETILDNEKLVSTLELVRKDYDNQRSRIAEQERFISELKMRESKLERENETMNNDIGYNYLIKFYLKNSEINLIKNKFSLLKICLYSKICVHIWACMF